MTQENTPLPATDLAASIKDHPNCRAIRDRIAIIVGDVVSRLREQGLRISDDTTKFTIDMLTRADDDYLLEATDELKECEAQEFELRARLVALCQHVVYEALRLGLDGETTAGDLEKN